MSMNWEIFVSLLGQNLLFLISPILWILEQTRFAINYSFDFALYLSFLQFELLNAPFIYWFGSSGFRPFSDSIIFPEFELLTISIFDFFDLGTNITIERNYTDWLAKVDYYTQTLTLKFMLGIAVLIVIRGCIPRYRYDFLTKIGWLKFLGLTIFWFLAVAVLILII